MREDIIRQKIENENKIKQFQMENEFRKQEQDKLAVMKREQIQMNYNQHASAIKEANEICRMLGKNISFKQCIVQNFLDDSNRNTRINGYEKAADDDLQAQRSRGSVNMNEEHNIQVRNHDKNTIVMWSFELFYDRLETMRDSLNQFEDAKKKSLDKQKQRQLEMA